jgi:signal transduction histidine kinase
MSLRLRIFLAFSTLVLVTVGLGAVLSSFFFREQLEAQLVDQRVAELSQAITREVRATRASLDRHAVEISRRASQLWGLSRAERYGWASGEKLPGRVDVVKVLDEKDGRIVSSGHHRASFGYRDSLLGVYKNTLLAEENLVAVTEPVAGGSSLAIEEIRRIRGPQGARLVVVGRLFDQAAREEMRARLGADVLAVCSRTPRKKAACWYADKNQQLPPYSESEPSRLLGEYAWEPVGWEVGKRGGALSFLVGVSRREYDQLQTLFQNGAMLLAGFGILLAALFGFFLAGRMVKPIDALSSAAQRLSEGDLSTQVEKTTGSGRELKQLVDTFNHMAQALELSQKELRRVEKVAAWREIARGLAHELKNPLTPIRGALDVIRKAHQRERPDFSEILDEQAQAVEEEVIRLKELADSFARFARLPEPSLERVELKALFNSVVRLYAENLDDVQVQIEVQPADLSLFADAAQLRTVFTNLIKNAVEAMEGRGQIRMTAARAEMNQVRIEIKDSGPGIATELLEEIFTPYVTTKGSGTGLGLALAHRIVEEHGGRIDALNDPDGGACFVLILPAATHS